jgi:hypothetical protein
MPSDKLYNGSWFPPQWIPGNQKEKKKQ